MLDLKKNPHLWVPHGVSIQLKGGRTVPCVLSVYLGFKKDYTLPIDVSKENEEKKKNEAQEEKENIILAVTGGEGAKDDEVFTDEGTFLGNVLLNIDGAVVIELQDWVRDAVSNLLKSERGEVCMPVIWQGSIHVLKDTPALCHSLHNQPRQVVITGIDTDFKQPFFEANPSKAPIGSLVTATQGGAGSRQLHAYGYVNRYLEAEGRRAALIALIHPAIEALQAQDDRFRGMTAFVLAPILQPESDSDPGKAYKKLLCLV